MQLGPKDDAEVTNPHLALQHGQAVPGTAPEEGLESHTSESTESMPASQSGSTATGDTWSREALPAQRGDDTDIGHQRESHGKDSPGKHSACAGRQETQPAASALTAACFSGNLRPKIEHFRCFHSFWPSI